MSVPRESRLIALSVVALWAAGLAAPLRGRSTLAEAQVQRYVPAFPRKRGDITTRLVAGHIAGIRHDRGDESLSSRR